MRKYLLSLTVSALVASTFSSSSPVAHGAAAPVSTDASVVVGNDPQEEMIGGEALVVSPTGRVFVSQPSANRIVVLEPGATRWETLIGGNGSGAELDQLCNPRGLALDSTGNLYVADSANNRVLRFAPGATSGTIVAGGNNSGSALDQLNGPWSIAVGPQGELYVGDANNARVLRYDTLGQAVTGTIVAGGNGVGSALNQTSYPYGIALSGSENPDLYISDYSEARVVKWVQGDATGTEYAASPTTGSLTSPRGLFFDGGDLYVTAQSSNSVFKKSASGTFNRVLGTGSKSYSTASVRAPVAVASAGTGEVYVLEEDRLTRRALDGSTTTVIIGVTANPATTSDFMLDLKDIAVNAAGNVFTAEGTKVRRWTPGSSVGVVVAGGNGEGAGANQLSGAEYIYVDAADNVYVSEIYNHRVTKWAPGATEGVVVAGGNGPGDALNQLQWPRGVTVDSSGNVYVADFYNNRIVTWAPSATEGVHIVGSKPAGPSDTNFYWVHDVALDGAGVLYAADFYGRRIVKWNAVTSLLETVADGTKVGTPSYLDADAAGNLVISSGGHSRLTYWAAGASTGTDLFNEVAGEPAGVTFDSTGRIWAADSYTDSVLAQRTRGSLTATPPGAKVLGDAPFEVLYSGPASPAGPVVTATPAEVCSASGLTITLVGAGSCSVTVAVQDALLFAPVSDSFSFAVAAPATTTTTPAPTTTTPVVTTTPPTTTEPPAPALKLSVKCSTKSRTLNCTATKPTAASSKAKLRYRLSCASATGSKAKSVSSSSKKVLISLPLKAGSWRCTVSTSYRSKSYVATTTKKIR